MDRFTSNDPPLLLEAAPEVGQSESWIVAPIIPRGRVTTIGTDEQLLGTRLALSLAATIAAKHAFCRMPTQFINVAHISMCDPPYAIWNELRRVAAAHAFAWPQIASNIVLKVAGAGFFLAQDEWVDGRKSVAEGPGLAELRELCSVTPMVIIDSLQYAYRGELDRHESSLGLLRLLEDVAQATRCAIVALTCEGSARGGRSSIQLASRSRLTVTRSGRRTIRVIHDPTIGQTRALPLDLLLDPSGIFLPLSPAAIADKRASDEAEVLAAIRSANHAGDVVPTRRFGDRSGSRVLSEHGLSRSLTSTQGRKSMWEAVDNLERQGAIKRLAGRPGSFYYKATSRE